MVNQEDLEAELKNIRHSPNFRGLKDDLFELLEENQFLFTADHRENDYWIYFDIKKRKFKLSAPVTSSTCLNPANWYPHYPKFAFHRLHATDDLWIDVDDETIKFYQENFSDFDMTYNVVDDIWKDFVNEIDHLLNKVNQEVIIRDKEGRAIFNITALAEWELEREDIANLRKLLVIDDSKGTIPRVGNMRNMRIGNTRLSRGQRQRIVGRIIQLSEEFSEFLAEKPSGTSYADFLLDKLRRLASHEANAVCYVVSVSNISPNRMSVGDRNGDSPVLDELLVIQESVPRTNSNVKRVHGDLGAYGSSARYAYGGFASIDSAIHYIKTALNGRELPDRFTSEGEFQSVDNLVFTTAEFDEYYFADDWFESDPPEVGGLTDEELEELAEKLLEETSEDGIGILEMDEYLQELQGWKRI